YLPVPRGCLARLADLVVIASAIAAIAIYARRESIDCARDAMGACRLTTIGAFETESIKSIEGIRSMAHRSGSTLYVVTDAKNKDPMAAFGQRRIELWDTAPADEVEGFVEGRAATVALSHGPRHPAILTAVVLFALLFYAWATRSLGFVVTVDPENG